MGRIFSCHMYILPMICHASDRKPINFSWGPTCKMAVNRDHGGTILFVLNWVTIICILDHCHLKTNIFYFFVCSFCISIWQTGRASLNFLILFFYNGWVTSYFFLKFIQIRDGEDSPSMPPSYLNHPFQLRKFNYKLRGS